MNDQNFVEDPSTQTTAGRILSTGLKVEGWDYRARVVKNAIFGSILILLAIYLVYRGDLAIGGVLVLFAALLFLGAWFYWWRSKSLVKGKFYVPPESKQINSQ